MSNPATVIVFVPGTTASELFFDVPIFGLVEAWPGILKDTNVASRAAKAYAMENSTSPMIGNIVSSYPAPSSGDKDIPCYADLLAFMTGNAFSGIEIDTPFNVYCCSDDPDPLPTDQPQHLLYTVPYDWRIDNGASATARLLPALNNLDIIYPDGNYNLYLVAHSNGGLVSRYLLEHVQPAGAGWWAKLQAFITLATPHLGSALAWVPITGQKLSDKENDLAVAFVTSVVDNSKFPSTFQLIPPQGINFILDGDDTAEDIYAAALQPTSQLFHDMKVTCGVNIGNLSLAANFQSDLDLNKAPCPYHFFYGTDLATLSIEGDTYAEVAFKYTPGDTSPDTVFTPQAAPDIPLTGDTVVPALSAMGGKILPGNVTNRPYSKYTHGDMGGCDMTGHQASILDMLEICGVGTKNVSSQAAE